MKRVFVAVALLMTCSVPVQAEDLTIDLRYEPTASTEPPQGLFATVKRLRPVRIGSFLDKRAVDDTFVGELKVNGQPRKVLAKTSLAIFATDVFRKVYSEWGGKISPDEQLVLKGEITQLKIEEADGYQARVGFHFSLNDDGGKVLWDGHTSGIVRGSGRSLTPESLSVLISDILRATYAEMLEDNKLIGVWTGKVSNTYVIREGMASSAAQAGGR